MNITIRMTAIAVGAMWLCSTLVVRAECDASVAKEPAASRFTVKGEAAYDKKTDLTWMRCGRGQQWKEGGGCVGELQKFTYAQSHAGLTDGWRLPSLEELQTIIAPHCKNPAIDGEIISGHRVRLVSHGHERSLKLFASQFRRGQDRPGLEALQLPLRCEVGAGRTVIFDLSPT